MEFPIAGMPIDHVVDLHPGVRERRVEHLEQLPHRGLARRETGHLLVFDVIVCVRSHESVSMFIRRHRSDRGNANHGQRGCPAL